MIGLYLHRLLLTGNKGRHNDWACFARQLHVADSLLTFLTLLYPRTLTSHTRSSDLHFEGFLLNIEECLRTSSYTSELWSCDRICNVEEDTGTVLGTMRGGPIYLFDLPYVRCFLLNSAVGALLNAFGRGCSTRCARRQPPQYYESIG